MTTFLDAIHKAQADMAETMSSELRHVAVKDGWEPEVAAGISVKHADGTLMYDLGEKHRDRAFVHEFGDERVRPKATIRKYLNNISGLGKGFVESVNKHSKESK